MSVSYGEALQTSPEHACPPAHPSAGCPVQQPWGVFNIGGVSVIVPAPHGPGSSKLPGQAGPPPARQLHQPNWGSGRALLAEQLPHTGHPRQQPRLLMSLWLFH